MKNSLNNNCKAFTEQLNSYSYETDLPDELKDHLIECEECKFVFEENLRLKKLVRGAVKRTPVPEELRIRIADKIFRDKNVLGHDQSAFRFRIENLL